MSFGLGPTYSRGNNFDFRERPSAVQCIRQCDAIPSAEQALRANKRRRHDKPELQRMGHRLWRFQDDYGAARPSHASSPHHRDRQRQLPFQEQFRVSPKRHGETEELNQHEPYLRRVTSRRKSRAARSANQHTSPSVDGRSRSSERRILARLANSLWVCHV